MTRRYRTGTRRPFLVEPGDLPRGRFVIAGGAYMGQARLPEPDPADCCEVCGGELDDPATSQPAQPWRHDQAASGKAHYACAMTELAYFEMLEDDGE